MKTLLVPVDFSETSLAALSVARELARSTGAQLVLVHADDFPIMPIGEPAFLPAHVIEEHERTVKERLGQLAERARQGGLTVQSRALPGPAHEVILDAAKADGADLIVMGTHGRRGFRRVMLGSVTERVVRISKVPVLVVPVPGAAESA